MANISKRFNCSDGLNNPNESNRLGKSNGLNNPNKSNRLSKSNGLNNPNKSNRLGKSNGLNNPNKSNRLSKSNGLNNPNKLNRLSKSNGLNNPNKSSNPNNSTDINNPNEDDDLNNPNDDDDLNNPNDDDDLNNPNDNNLNNDTITTLDDLELAHLTSRLHGMTERPDSTASMPMRAGAFQTMGLSPRLLRRVFAMGLRKPTPIQRRMIPAIATGRDVVATARTGSGKTLGFAIPILNRILWGDGPPTPFAVIMLAPTRELVQQIAAVVSSLLAEAPAVRVAALAGGDHLYHSFEHVHRRPTIVVATPGRLLHVIAEANLSFAGVATLVMDEADALFESRWRPQVDELLEKIPRRQTVIVSATLPVALAELARAALRDVLVVRLPLELPPTLELVFVGVRSDCKVAAVVRAVTSAPNTEPPSTLIFVPSRHHVDLYRAVLAHAGICAATLHGQMDPAARKIQMARFAHRKTDVAVATDVAARGIDFANVDRVINTGVPPSAKLFLHRIGRTARAGRLGCAITFVGPAEMPAYRSLSAQLRDVTGADRVDFELRNAPDDLDIFVERVEGIRRRDADVEEAHRRALGAAKLVTALQQKMVARTRKRRAPSDGVPGSDLARTFADRAFYMDDCSGAERDICSVRANDEATGAGPIGIADAILEMIPDTAQEIFRRRHAPCWDQRKRRYVGESGTHLRPRAGAASDATVGSAYALWQRVAGRVAVAAPAQKPMRGRRREAERFQNQRQFREAVREARQVAAKENADRDRARRGAAGRHQIARRERRQAQREQEGSGGLDDGDR